jgi:tripartite-type tricarboxylate transporter receptor subunit TctC
VALSAKRDPSFPDVPTAKEAGLSAVAELWRGIVVPNGTPRRIVAKLEDIVRQTVQDPEFARAAQKLLVTPAFLPGAEFGRLIAKEDAEIAKAVAAMGLKKSAK